MTTLHLINKSSENSACWTDMEHTFSAGDSLLLIENAVYAVRTLPAEFCDDKKCYALLADLEARGLNTESSPHIETVDDKGFVTLTTEYDNVVSWF